MLGDASEGGYPVFLPARSISQADRAEIIRVLRRAVIGRERRERERERVAAAVKAATDAAAAAAVSSNVVTIAATDSTAAAAEGPTGPPSEASSVSPTPAKSTTRASPPSARTDAATHSHRPYPMHTKRAETIVAWLYAMAAREGGATAVAIGAMEPIARSLDS
ncbi:hypothetical protein BDK51DRAFT_50501 [Blyttiomyces helicus]|uniref:Uncharacterized protein n=1 Tax=Blyttiomyces helicus TaxID=388810 RepID=A0A4P9VUX1_9FUNG|nr:hypothetical protein BDK51DRAFT_50501 [Blyttiomyces helicus]|eukprot:RKO82912.1 hypothetical protein BDK51DRAFT_50501 [Blyttiomyces helicus]